MSTGKNAPIIFVSTLLIGAGLVLGFLTRIEPESASFIVRAGFYCSFFLFLFGLSGLLTLGFRRLIGTRTKMLGSDAILRQSIFLGLLGTFGLLAQAARLLNPLTAILLLVMFGLLEIFFLTK